MFLQNLVLHSRNVLLLHNCKLESSVLEVSSRRVPPCSQIIFTVPRRSFSRHFRSDQIGEFSPFIRHVATAAMTPPAHCWVVHVGSASGSLLLWKVQVSRTFYWSCTTSGGNKPRFKFFSSPVLGIPNVQDGTYFPISFAPVLLLAGCKYPCREPAVLDFNQIAGKYAPNNVTITFKKPQCWMTLHFKG